MCGSDSEGVLIRHVLQLPTGLLNHSQLRPHHLSDAHHKERLRPARRFMKLHLNHHLQSGQCDPGLGLLLGLCCAHDGAAVCDLESQRRVGCFQLNWLREVRCEVPLQATLTCVPGLVLHAQVPAGPQPVSRRDHAQASLSHLLLCAGDDLIRDLRGQQAVQVHLALPGHVRDGAVPRLRRRPNCDRGGCRLLAGVRGVVHGGLHLNPAARLGLCYNRHGHQDHQMLQSKVIEGSERGPTH